MGKFLGVKNILRQQQTKQNTLNGSEWKRVYAKMGFYEKSQMIISSSNWHWLDQCLAINAGPTFDPLSINSPVEFLSDRTKGSNSAPIIWSTRSAAEKLVKEISCSARSRLTKRISLLYCENICLYVWMSDKQNVNWTSGLDQIRTMLTKKSYSIHVEWAYKMEIQWTRSRE